MKKECNVLISGDLVVTENFNERLNIDKNIIQLFEKSDLNIINLECPITNASKIQKIKKTGPNIKGSRSKTLEVLDDLNIGLVTLANNHILDYGEKGIKDTLKFCKENNVGTVGANTNLKEAEAISKHNINGNSISIINFAENEWSSAGEDTAGANPMDIIANVNQIKNAKCESDVVIVIIHGGHEYYNLPSPRIVNQYRFYAENGASLIVGHHPHCISGSEVWKGVPIYYSLGNFLFTTDSTLDDWYKGLVLDIHIGNKKINSCNVIPVKQNRDNFNLTLPTSTEKNIIVGEFSTYSSIIKDPEHLKSKWVDFVTIQSAQYNSMLNFTFIKNPLLLRIIKKLRLDGHFLDFKTVMLFLNLIRCESHYDLTKEILKIKYENSYSKAR